MKNYKCQPSFAQLSLEYDSHPPLDAGSPDKAGEEVLGRYRKLVARHAPNRQERYRAPAARLD